MASAKVVAYAHAHYPQFQLGDMNVFLTAYPLTCDPKDILATQQHNNVLNWFCSDVQIRGAYRPIWIGISGKMGQKVIRTNGEDLTD